MRRPHPNPTVCEARFVRALALSSSGSDAAVALRKVDASLRRVVVVAEIPGANWPGAIIPARGERIDEEAASLLVEYRGFSRGAASDQKLDGAVLAARPEVAVVPVLLGVEVDAQGIGATLRHVLDESSVLAFADTPLASSVAREALGGEGETDAGPLGGRWPCVPALDGDDRSALGEIVERCLRAAAAGEKGPDSLPTTPRLRRPGGAFVTLKENGSLRGCMGRLAGPTLASAVAHAADMAVRDDPRFDALGIEELARCDVEISVLGRFEEIGSPEEFEPGRHGLVLTRGWNRGLLLPQVATEWGMDRGAFLEALARKAGLDPSDWREAKLERFGVEAFRPTHR